MTGRPRARPEPWAGREAHGHSAAPGALVRSRGPRPLTWPSPAHVATIQPWLIG